MKKLLLTTRHLSFVLLFLLSGCIDGGGGGGSGSTTTIDTATTDDDTAVSVAGTVYGPISGFGSIFVNGIEFSTGETVFSRSGQSSSESEFQVGDMVGIQGTLNADGRTGTASSISYQENVFGVITRASKNGSLEVLGQTVVNDSFTDLKGIFMLDDLPLGTILEVSGIADGRGYILATRIINRDDQGPAAGSSVIGISQNLDQPAKTFTIGNLTVDYSGANLLNIPEGGLSDGLAVQVSSSQTVSGNVLIADVVQGTGVVNGSENDRAKVTGIISGVDGSNNLYIDLQPVQILDTTNLVNGTSSEILNGAAVEAEGVLDSNGVLIIEEVFFRPANKIVFIANVNAIDLEDSTITVLGTTAIVQNHTMLRDESAAKSRPFGLANVNLGDGVELRAYVDSVGNLIASLIERYELFSEVTVRGTATSADSGNNMVNVLGTTIIVTVDTRYEDINNDPITKEAFFSAIEPGVTVVKAEGAATGSDSFTANGIRIK